MRILYGVVGEGMGHATRSAVVVHHLISDGHEVEVMASQRAVGFLQSRFPEVHRIHGLHLIAEENRVRRGKTFWSNIVAGTAAVPKNLAAYFDLIDDFSPDVVISDFESWTYWYAKTHGLPVISIDNMQVINRCEHAPEILEGQRTNFEIARAFVKSKLPFCDHYFVTTFFAATLRKDDTTIVPPILRRSILDAKASRGDHLLVYQTAEGHDSLQATLAALGVECRVYGMRRDLKEEVVEGNLRYRPFDEVGFVADLASAKAVIAGGGFSLMSEAVYLHKPMLSVPMGNQFEQVLNGRYLEAEAFGLSRPSLEDPAVVHAFLAELPRFEQALAGYRQDGNDVLFAALEEQFDRVLAGV